MVNKTLFFTKNPSIFAARLVILKAWGKKIDELSLSGEGLISAGSGRGLNKWCGSSVGRAKD
jgi:hypothetical protein